MVGEGITLFKLFGFEVKADASWLILALLITFSLAQGFFPADYTGLSTYTYWIMGLVGAVGIFMSIVFHELSHSIVARRFGLPIRKITLFIFGGVAHMDEEPPSARAEFSMSVVGPLTSILLAGAMYLIYLGGRSMNWPVSVLGVVRYLRDINFILALFNMVPAFPLDGGRILRSGLWKWKGSLRWATKISSRVGGGFGILLIVAGVFFMFRGAFFTGLWWVLIGFFLRSAAQGAYRKLLFVETLKGEPVSRFMETDVITVGPNIPVEDLVQDYVYTHHHKMYPITRGEQLIGCVTTREVKELPRDQWAKKTVGEIAQDCSSNNTINKDADATEALKLMNSSRNSRLLVVDDGRLVGIVSLKDLLKFLSLKLDLEEDEIALGAK